MLRIGDFSRLGKVTIQTLRHYDQLGLLKPVEVDHFTGYRFYSATQLPRLNRILLLKDLGFTLDQVKEMLVEDLPIEQFIGMLKLKRAEVEQHIAAEQTRLNQIEARLRWIAGENRMPEYEIALKPVEALKVFSIQDTVRVYGDVMHLWREIKRYLRSHGVGWAYPHIAIWQDIEYQEENIVAEAATPYVGNLPGTDRIRVKTLPALETVVSTIHQGDYEEFPQAYEALIKWNETNGYRVSGPIREVYIHYERDNLPANITEIQLPVTKI